MKVIRQNAKPASVLLTILMLSITIPYQSVFAAMIETEATLDSMQAQQARANINNLLLREDVQSALMAQGINPIEAKARIDSLSDAEVVRIADQIDKLPSGGYLEVWIGILILAGLVLILITSLVTMKYFEPEYPSVDDVDEKSVAIFNPQEPWSGNWQVETPVGGYNGKWGMKQDDNRVISTKYSIVEFRGKVEGNKLKGSWGPPGMVGRIELEISPDGQSFKGTVQTFRTISVEGMRIK